MAKGYLKEIEYRQSDISFYILRLMKQNHVNQSELAKVVGVTQGRISQELNEGSFSTHELLTIFKYLKADQESVGKLFTF